MVTVALVELALFGLVALEPIMVAEVEAVLLLVLLRVLVAWEVEVLVMLVTIPPLELRVQQIQAEVVARLEAQAHMEPQVVQAL
jgi:hypothetical protein